MFRKIKQWFQKRWSKPKIVLIFPQKKKGTIEIPPYIPESYSSKSDVNLSKTSLCAFPPGKKGTTEIKPLIEEYVKQHPLKYEDYSIKDWFYTDERPHEQYQLLPLSPNKTQRDEQ